MRTLYLLIAIYTGLFLSACSTTSTNDPMTTPVATQPPLKPKNPMTVTVYTKKQPLKAPYKVLGLATISKYNLGGIKRQEASIRDNMRNLAASMGGDAVIDIARDDKSVTGTVIAYQNDKKQKSSAV